MRVGSVTLVVGLCALLLAIPLLTAAEELEMGTEGGSVMRGQMALNGARVAAATSVRALTTTLAPSQSVSTAQANAIYSEFPFFGIYETATFSLCYNQLFYQCIPGLRESRSSWQSHWTNVSSQCFSQYCTCLPGGTFSGSRCTYNRPPPGSQCAMIEKCVPVQDRCIQTFVITPGNLPSTCTEFINCAALESVRRANFLECVDYRNIVAPGCNHEMTCKFISSDGGSSGGDDGNGSMSRFMLVGSVVVACLVTPLLVCIIYIITLSMRHRRAAAMMAADAAEERFIDESGRDPSAPLAAWYGDALRVEVPPPSDGAAANASTSLAPAGSAPKCSYCGAISHALSHHRFINVPCRCQWCGRCDFAAPVTGATDSSGGKKTCRRCGLAIDHTVDLECVFVNTGGGAHSTETGARDHRRSGECPEDIPMETLTASGGGHDIDAWTATHCSICLDANACVVFLPCNHLAACSECAHTIVTNVNRRNGRLVAPRCHMCRATIEAAVVLSPAAMNYAAVNSPTARSEASPARPVASPLATAPSSSKEGDSL